MAKWKEIKKHLYKEFPEGWFFKGGAMKPRETPGTAWMILGFLTIVVFLWLAVNAPTESWRNIGMIYALMGTLVGPTLLIEWMHPKITFPTAFPRSIGDMGHDMDVIAALLIVIGTSIVSAFVFTMTGKMAFFMEIFPELPWVNLVIVGLSIPIIEEVFFGCLFGATMIENFGVVTGILTTSFTFTFFHYATYGLSVPMLVPIFLFRTLASIAMIRLRSGTPGIYSHCIVNSCSVLGMMIL